jgi:PAS domain S-box-containing protein
LARARELSRQESFRELLGFRKENGAAAEAEESGEEEELGAEPIETPDSASSLIDEIADPLLKFDDDWRITHANAEALAYFGGKHPLIGRNFWEGFDPVTREKYVEEFRRPLADGARHTFEFRDSERDRWLEANVYRSSGGLLALFRDVSSRKREEAEKVRVQRLEGLGLLARGFAHDFNNLLTVLVGNLDFARERLPDDAEFQEEMRDAESAAGHARNLVLQLLTFAQGGRPVRETTRVADLLRQILAERRRERPNIRYQFQCADSNLRVNVDRGQIRRLI